MVKLRTLINRYPSVDCIRRKFHSLRAEHTLVYKLVKIKNPYGANDLVRWPHVKYIKYGARSELEPIFRTLNESMFKHRGRLYELEHFDIHSTRFYYKDGRSNNKFYIAMTVSIKEDIYCTLNISDPLSKQGDIDDLDIFMRGSAPQDVSRRVRTVLKLVEPPDKIRIYSFANPIRLARVTCDFCRLLEQGHLSYFGLSKYDESIHLGRTMYSVTKHLDALD